MSETPPETGVQSALPDDVREAVAVANVKAVGEQPAVLANLALANAVANQQAGNTLLTTLLGKVCESIIATNPGEGVVDTALAQILTKQAQTTPPVTAAG